MVVWFFGKVLGSRYRVAHLRRTGKYPWSMSDALKDGGFQIVALLALSRVNAILNDAREEE